MIIVLIIGIGSVGCVCLVFFVLVELVVKLVMSIVLIWLVVGNVVCMFDGLKLKGIDIVNLLGMLVVVVVLGVVVYVGNGLCGYGNLIILKYNVDYLMVYVYNCVLLVKEG